MSELMSRSEFYGFCKGIVAQASFIAKAEDLDFEEQVYHIFREMRVHEFSKFVHLALSYGALFDDVIIVRNTEEELFKILETLGDQEFADAVSSFDSCFDAKSKYIYIGRNEDDARYLRTEDVPLSSTFTAYQNFIVQVIAVGTGELDE